MKKTNSKMKTLDEVIDDLELLRVTTQSESEYKPVISALHYLKEYRSDQLEWKGTRKAFEELGQAKFAEYDKAKQKYIDRLKELDIGTQNKPLTWDELREMEGKPVWLEGDNIKPHWDIIARIEYDFDHDCTECEFYVLGGTFTYCDKFYGETWQAYRKERK